MRYYYEEKVSEMCNIFFIFLSIFIYTPISWEAYFCCVHFWCEHHIIYRTSISHKKLHFWTLFFVLWSDYSCQNMLQSHSSINQTIITLHLHFLLSSLSSEQWPSVSFHACTHADNQMRNWVHAFRAYRYLFMLTIFQPSLLQC